MQKRALGYLLLTGLWLAIPAVSLADDKPKLMTGADVTMLAGNCIVCHGSNGNSEGPAIPSIAGVSEQFMIDMMDGFKKDEVPSTIMGRIAKGYSDDEIKALAKYFSRKTFAKAKQDFDPALAKKGAKLHQQYCEKCHAKGGTSVEDDTGILAGQWRTYLEWAIADYRNGVREPSRKMKKRLEELAVREGKAGYKALLNYYASQK